MRKLLPFILLILSFNCIKGQTVYKTPYGKKYHLATCQSVKNVSEAITVQQAREMGLEPCKICKPQVSYGNTQQTKKPQGQSVTVQCKGITRSGNRCKHRTSIANGYCFQHQPK